LSARFDLPPNREHKQALIRALQQTVRKRRSGKPLNHQQPTPMTSHQIIRTLVSAAVLFVLVTAVPAQAQ
jgi:hypothetical protein